MYAVESTLSLKKTDLEQKVGLFFGWGASRDDWEDDANKVAVIDDCVQSGLRQFYFPPPMDGIPYDWSFLKPTASLTITSGNSTLELPDDFGGFEGKITVSSATQAFCPIKIYNEGFIRELYSKSADASGQIQAAAVRPLKGTGLTQGTRSELYVFPQADADYTILFVYYILANHLDGTHPYAYGGMAHAETILESCLSIAEQRYDDTRGVHSIKYLERLAASIALDRRMKPQTGGRNTDHSDTAGYRTREVVVTYNDVAY